MANVKDLIERARRTQNGFLDLQKAAEEVVAEHTQEESLQIAEQLYASESYPVRSLATFILGQLAACSPESLAFLKQTVSRDGDWRVQEILAKAFDRYCADSGYEQSLLAIRDWLGDPNPNVRRAVTEGLRIWTSRPYFRDHPEAAIQMLSPLRADPSKYVRKSVGNALRDISKKHAALVQAELMAWELTDKCIQQTYKLARKFLNEADDR